MYDTTNAEIHAALHTAQRAMEHARAKQIAELLADALDTHVKRPLEELTAALDKWRDRLGLDRLPDPTPAPRPRRIASLGASGGACLVSAPLRIWKRVLNLN